MNGKQRDRDEKPLARINHGRGNIAPGAVAGGRIDPPARNGVLRPVDWPGGLAIAALLFVAGSLTTGLQASEAGSSLSEAGGVTAAATAPQEEAPEEERDSLPPSEKMLQRRTRWSAQDNAARTADEHFRALGEPRTTDGGDAEAARLIVLPSETEVDDARGRASKPELALWLIGQLVSIGNAERAKAKIETFRERFPDREIPPQIISRLERL